MVLQAYIDDSADEKREKVFVLAGYLADSETWKGFIQEWGTHLNLCRIDSFKLSEMPQSKPEIIASFYRIIERHNITLSFDCVLEIPMWKKITNEIGWPPNSETMQRLVRNPYYITSKKLRGLSL